MSDEPTSREARVAATILPHVQDDAPVAERIANALELIAIELAALNDQLSALGIGVRK